MSRTRELSVDPVTSSDAARAQDETRRARLRSGKVTDFAIQASVLISIGLIWEIASRGGFVHPFLLPPLSEALMRLVSNAITGTLFIDLGLTLYRAVTGFAISAAIAVPLGVLMARSAPVRWFFDPLVSIGFPMPKIAFLPIFILWLDIYDTAKITMVAFSCFFVIVSASYAGTLAVDRWQVWSARSFGASERQVLTEIVLPMALPQILTGFQIALPVAMITTIVTEMLMGGRGIGGAMITAGRFADSVGVFSGIIAIALLGFAVIRTLEMIRRRILVWHAEARS